jgi:hypothetical protein
VSRDKRRPSASAPRSKKKRPLLAALLVAASALALTADERVFGLLTDGQMITRTAFSMLDAHELGIARGHRVGISRPQGDAVTRYGMLPSLVETVPMLGAESLERSSGPGGSQTLFVAEQIAWLLLAALCAGLLARAWGGDEKAGARALLACAVASPLAAYAGSDFSEPLLAALVGAAFLAAFRATASTGRRALLLACAAGALAGLALLAKSLLVLLLPCVLAILLATGETATRVKRGLFAAIGFAPVFAVWLVFEIVRFGRPFASYRGEKFSNPPIDGLWRLTIGPNKGLFLYFPLAVLSVLGAIALRKSSRIAALATAGFAAALLLATSAWWAWDGTAGWGPRLLLPLIPLLAAWAALGAASSRLRTAAFWALFCAGVLVNALGVFQPDALTTWYVTVLPKRALSPAEAARYPDFAYEKGADGVARLYPIHDVARHAAFSPIRLAAWLLHTRLASRDVKRALATPPWDTTVPGREVAVPPEVAIPRSALVFLTSAPRWPHLGMSLTRRKEELDTALAYVDCVYDQALRAQDMGLGDRAADYGERLYRLVPGPQTAVALLEGLRLAGRKEALGQWVRTIPRAHAATPEIGVVLALHERDLGEEAQARSLMARVADVTHDPRFRSLATEPLSQWPARLRDLTRPQAAAP